MDSEFAGKRVLVTGSGRGIGKAITKKLVEGGATVVALDKLQDLLDDLKTELPTIETLCVDLSDWEATRVAVTAAGPFDLAVNNAGIHIIAPFGQVEEETLDKLWAVNVKAVINISQIVANSLKERGKGGAIVNIASQLSHQVFVDHCGYAASKAAVASVTRTMALELGPYQIRCNSVHPTLVKTEMGRLYLENPVLSGEMLKRLPLGKFCEPEDIAEGVAFLLSDKRAALIAGHSLFIDAGGRVS